MNANLFPTTPCQLIDPGEEGDVGNLVPQRKENLSRGRGWKKTSLGFHAGWRGCVHACDLLPFSLCQALWKEKREQKRREQTLVGITSAAGWAVGRHRENPWGSNHRSSCEPLRRLLMLDWLKPKARPTAPSAFGPKIKAKSELGRCILDLSLGQGARESENCG